jgi:hypothetical protein
MKTLIFIYLLTALHFNQIDFFVVNCQNINYIQNEKNIIGNRFVPHNAFINITFKSDFTFIFEDYNSKLNKVETLIGKYKLKGSKLYLFYKDRPHQVFKYYKGNKGDENYYLKVATDSLKNLKTL